MEAKWIGSSGARMLSATFVFSSARPSQQNGRKLPICLSKSEKSKKTQAIQLDPHRVDAERIIGMLRPPTDNFLCLEIIRRY